MKEQKHTERIVEQLSMVKRMLCGENLKHELENLPTGVMPVHNVINKLMEKAINKELEETDYFIIGRLYYVLSRGAKSLADRYSLFMGSISCFKECKRNVSKAMMIGMLEELEEKWNRPKWSPFEFVMLKEVADYAVIRASKCGFSRRKEFLFYKEKQFHRRFDGPLNALEEVGFFDKKADRIAVLKEQLYQFTEGYDSEEHAGFEPFDPINEIYLRKEEEAMGMSINIVIRGVELIKEELIFYHLICMQNAEQAKTISPEEMQITFGSFSRETLESMIMTIKKIENSAINKVFIRDGESLIPISEYHYHKKRKLLSSDICQFSNEYRMLCEKLLSAGSGNNKELQKTSIIVDINREEDFELYFNHLSKIAEYSGLTNDKPRTYHIENAKIKESDGIFDDIPKVFHPENAKINIEGNESGRIIFFVIHGEIDEVIQSGMLDMLKKYSGYTSIITIWLCKLPEKMREREHAIKLISIPSYGLCEVVAPIKLSSGEARHALMKTLKDKEGIVLNEKTVSACASDVTCSIMDFEDAVNFIRFRLSGENGKTSDLNMEQILNEFESPVFQKPLLKIVDQCPAAKEIRLKYGNSIYRQLRRFIVTLLHNEVITHEFHATLMLYGMPGTRKTTLVEHIAKWTKEVGLTPNDDVHIAHGEEMVSQYIAGSATIQKKFLDPGIKSAVIFIDEAYKLMNAGAGGSNSSVQDSICCAGIDALLSFIDKNCKTTSSSRGHILVMAGYEDDMKKMTGPDFNQGFSSRIGMEIELMMPSGVDLAKEAEEMMRKQQKPSYSEQAIKKYTNFLKTGTTEFAKNGFNYRVLNKLLTYMTTEALIDGSDYIDEDHVDKIIEEYISNHESGIERVIGF